MAFRPDGRVALTGSLDGKARLWNPANGNLLGSPVQHEAAVVHVAFAPTERHS